MQVTVSVLGDPTGRKSAQLTMTSTDGQIATVCVMDGKSCRALAAVLMDKADELDKRIVTLTPQGGCPMCNGDSPDFHNTPTPHGGTWVHISKAHPGQHVRCLDAPTDPPPVNAA